MEDRTYVAIDLKSFYASVECVERGLDPLITNLVVADESRTEKTICLAVSPSLKSYGIPGRLRLFELIQKVKEVNVQRLRKAPNHRFNGLSSCDSELKVSPWLGVDYIVAVPQMAHYIDCSTRIYQIYLKYIAPEDIHVYSIDEVFMDVTNYLETYHLPAHDLVMKIILDVLNSTGITATAGIGTNLYLSKIAMDIEAKHIPADKNGVRIAVLDEISYRKSLWDHRPLRDFWRIGRGIAKKLEENGLFTMGDIARCSIGKRTDYYNEDLLYKFFGVNAELLIDHAWGWEPCTIADIKAYKTKTNSLGSGQVLPGPYAYDKARMIVQEMTESLVLDLVDKDSLTDQIVLTLGYDAESIRGMERRNRYQGVVTTDYYERSVPKQAHGNAAFKQHTSSTSVIVQAVLELFDHIADRDLLIRRVYLTANNVVRREDLLKSEKVEQLSLFEECDRTKENGKEEIALVKERKIQETMLEIKKKFGKNAIFKGMSLEEGATAIERNKQIGGHKA